jgi:CRP-like cAMP-binding protein
MPLKVQPRRDRKLNRTVKRGESQVLKRGEVLWKVGDQAERLVLVRSGHIQLVARLGTVEERVMAVAGPWEMTGEEGLFPGVKRRTGARAGEPTQITLLDGPSVNRALRTASRTYDAFLLAKEEELALARRMAEPRRAGSTAENLAAMILHLSDRLGKTEEGGGKLIPIRLTHKALADLVCCHRSTVTTTLNDWIYRGVMSQEKGLIRILRPRELGP